MINKILRKGTKLKARIGSIEQYQWGKILKSQKRNKILKVAYLAWIKLTVASTGTVVTGTVVTGNQRRRDEAATGTNGTACFLLVLESLRLIPGLVSNEDLENFPFGLDPGFKLCIWDMDNYFEEQDNIEKWV
ncbi:ethylene-responsive transcription factor ERF069-like [Senna tora]|uniref:Ethylene-responsive transcription factor ERF069-like n=1 Tax=Senna tora TaxID=362788 RepID=A0A834WGN0_9FABA|nr:ethylene-responsive transcription factor ERF069-like [Senna tora]